MEKPLEIIGCTAYVTVAGIRKIPAKIDTGADSSSIWASRIKVASSGELSFVLFDETSPLYTGEVLKFDPDHYEVGMLRNSTGDIHLRYRVRMPTSINGRRINITFSLANRSKSSMPILIGRRSLAGKFLVDVTKNPTNRSYSFREKSTALTLEMRKNPHAFYLKYKGGKI